MGVAGAVGVAGVAWRALRARYTCGRQVIDKDLVGMLVREPKVELEARSESMSKTGNREWLRRRLHGEIVRNHLDAVV